MRIAVNVRFLLKGKLEGFGWFTHEIFKRMVQNHPEHEFFFFFDRPYDNDFVFADNVTPIVLAPQARLPILWTIWFEHSVKNALSKHKIDLFISTDGFCSRRTKVPQLLTIHDLAFEHYPEHLPGRFRRYLRRNTPKFAQKADHIVAVSQYTKEDINRQYNIPLDKISVVYNGAHEDYQVLEAAEKKAIQIHYANGKEYFVFAGALHPRKNIERLLKAFAIFKKKTASDIQLLIVGRFAWNSENIKSELAMNAYKNEIHLHDYMNVDKLSKVIGSAHALCFVSIFEGFGIPILEASKCGVPALVSNSSSLPEVAGDGALYVEATDIEAMATQMERLVNEPQLYAELSQKALAQAEKFSWDKSATDFWEVIQKKFT